MAHDVFISYSSKDKPTADAACAVLESRGIRCWIAPRDILPGTDWGESIVDAIAASRVMVLIVSGNANVSPQVKREAERAVHNDVAIVPLRIEDVPLNKSLEYFISTPHWLDALTPPLDLHLHRLADTLAALLARPAHGAVAGAAPAGASNAAAPPVLGRQPAPGSWQPPQPEPQRGPQAQQPQGVASPRPFDRPAGWSPPAPEQPGANGLAVVSLVASVIGCCTFVPSLVGVATGWVALRRSRRPGVGGRGMATAGFVISVLGAAAWIFLGIIMAFVTSHEVTARPMAEQFLTHMSAGEVDAAAGESDGLTAADLQPFAQQFKAWGPFEGAAWDSQFTALGDSGSPSDYDRALVRGTATFAHRAQPVRLFMHDVRGAWRVYKFEMGAEGVDR